MLKRIDITIEENNNVENLFNTYISYINMLSYITELGTDNTTLYDRKWKETSDLWIELDKAKRAIESKYKPNGDWDRYEFDFENHQVIFIKDV